jgi:hypothetical protein
LREPTGNLLNHTDMSRLDGHELDIFFLSGFLYKRKFIFWGVGFARLFSGIEWGPLQARKPNPKKRLKFGLAE